VALDRGIEPRIVDDDFDAKRRENLVCHVFRWPVKRIRQKDAVAGSGTGHCCHNDRRKA